MDGYIRAHHLAEKGTHIHFKRKSSSVALTFSSKRTISTTVTSSR